MSGAKELTYSELRCKEIVNAADGRRLGRILDMVFTGGGEILGIVAPFGRKGLFFKSQEVYIPFKCIKKIGQDVILVELNDAFSHGHKDKHHKDKPNNDYKRDGHDGYYTYEAECRDSHQEGHRHNEHNEEHHEVKHGCGHKDNRPAHKVYDCDGGHHDGGHKDNRHTSHKVCDCDGGHYDSCGYKDNRHTAHKVCDCDEGHYGGHGGGNISRPDCDKRCEKCMLFDCLYRWGEREKCCK